MYSIEKSKGLNLLKNYDYVLFISVIVLSIFGLLILRSATLFMPNIDGDRVFMGQTISWVIGIVLAILISSFDYKDFKNIGFILYGLSVLLLILVLFFSNSKGGQPNSWFDLPGIGSFQPSEIAKISFVIMAAFYFEKIKDRHQKKYNSILKLIVIMVIPIALVLLQPDAGTAMVFIFTIMIMMFIAGIPYKYIIGGVIVTIPIVLCIYFFVLDSYQQLRVKVFLNPELDLLGRGWNVYKSKIAVGSGQIFGKGLFQGIQTQNNGVPVKESDFIFSVIGEELGFIGSIILLILVLIVLLRCIYIAKNSRDTFGSYLAVGLTAMMAFHYIENVSMNIGMLPVTGIPMPFISQGGSALVTYFISIGIILSVSIRRTRSMFKN